MPLWSPGEERRRSSKLFAFARRAPEWGAPETAGVDGSVDYAALHAWSLTDANGFWTAVWEFCGVISSTGSESVRAPETMGLPSPEGPGWFPDTKLNFAENLLKGPADQAVLVSWDEKGRGAELTRHDLRRAVAQFADGLRGLGIESGDRVAGFLPTIAESVVAMLGAASVGAVWTSCSPDFGTAAVLDRFGQTEPRLLVAAVAYSYKGKVIECLPRIAEIASRLPTVERCVVAGGGPLDSIANAVRWEDFGGKDSDLVFEPMPFQHPLAILYSSGTTGLPKCIVHGAGGTLLQHLKELVLHTDIGPNDRLFYYTTCGWMMWNWLVSGLAAGATVVLYSGAPHAPSSPPKDPTRPDQPDMLWTVAEAEELTVFGCSAKYLALMEKERVEPRKSHDLSRLRTVLSTGSPLPPQSFEYVYRDVKEDVHLASISGGTDLISCFVLGIPTRPVYSGEIQGPGLGMAVEVQGPSGERVTGVAGELVCTKPFPSMPLYFWDDPDQSRYRAAYFEAIPGVWRHGDWAEETASRGWVIHGRSDATLNPGGVRIGTAEIYRQVEAFDEILESVAVAREVATDGTHVSGVDTEIALFVRLRPGEILDDQLTDRVRARIRREASPHHVPKTVVQVDDIPRTVSGKVSEIAVREAIHGRPVPNHDALANPECLGIFRGLRTSRLERNRLEES